MMPTFNPKGGWALDTRSKNSRAAPKKEKIKIILISLRNDGGKKSAIKSFNVKELNPSLREGSVEDCID